MHESKDEWINDQTAKHLDRQQVGCIKVSYLVWEGIRSSHVRGTKDSTVTVAYLFHNGGLAQRTTDMTLLCGCKLMMQTATDCKLTSLS